MNNYTVAFIDDDKGIIDDFLATAEQELLNVKVLKLVSQKDTLVSEIIEANVDAVIIDYHLTDTRSDIKYNGAEVVTLLDEETVNLPKFIFTAFSSSAEDASNDINIVYAKEGDFSPFIKKVIKQIEKYKKRIQSYEGELDALIQKSKQEKLSVKEEERALELDSIIEKTLNKKLSIPESLKKPSTISTLDKILAETREIVKELKKKNEQ